MLERDYGIKISVGRVYRLMKGMQLLKMSTVKPNYKKTLSGNELPCSNLLKQQFNPTAPNLVWVSDITYINVGGRFAYLCVVIDLFARKVIAFRVHSKMDSLFVIQTMQDALDKREATDSLLFHSDRGSQYTSAKFRHFLDDNNITQSFSKAGHPWDNAVVESFFKYLKYEELDRKSFHTIAELKLATFKYINGFYNSKRPHSANNTLTPDEKEKQFCNIVSKN